LFSGEVRVAVSWKPMMVTAALVGVVLAVDDATTARPGNSDQPPAQHVGSEATATPTVAPSEAPPGEPVPQGLGVIQTTDVPGRTVALTFDDGPSPDYTAEVLDILDRHGVTATFCVVGKSVKAHPELVSEIADRGHTLCDHTLTHDLTLPDHTEQHIRAEIGGTLDLIRAAVPDAEVRFYRAPGGKFSAEVIRIAASYEQQPLGWSVDPRDWTDASADEIRTAILDAVRPGSIVLLHDGGGDQSETVVALDDIITGLRTAGFEFVIPRT
jgi:peptidoglycan/xylan/chitin deacetylase (PgdA/CDA1 family)